MKEAWHNSDKAVPEALAMGMGGLVNTMVERGMSFPLLVAVGIVLIVLIRTAGNVVKSVAREKTRREIAAYIAEGTMNPEQGERLMKAGKGVDEI